MSSPSQRYSSASRACKHCKAVFWSESGRQMVCANCKRAATRERMRQWIARNPNEHRARSAASWKPRAKDRQNATAAVYRAIKRGDLTRGCCEVCGTDAVQAHHDDYGKPLQVRWLCRPHHAIEHRKEPNHVVGK